MQHNEVFVRRRAVLVVEVMVLGSSAFALFLFARALVDGATVVDVVADFDDSSISASLRSRSRWPRNVISALCRADRLRDKNT